MKKMSTAVVVFGLLASGPVLAQQGWYVGGSVGQSHTKFEGLPDNAIVDTPSGQVSLRKGSEDKTKTGWTTYVGYDFTKNWAVEGGYADFGKPSYRYLGTGGFTGLNARSKVEQSSWFVVGKGTWPLTDQFALYAKLGAGFNRAKESVSASYGTAYASSSDTKNRTELIYGIGAQYSFTPNWSARVEYTDFGKFGDGDNVVKTKANIWSLGVAYKF